MNRKYSSGYATHFFILNQDLFKFARFFNMFVQLDIVQNLHTQFLKFSLPPVLMALEVSKEKSKNMNMQTRNEE
jgi:hypothetical protein